MQVEDDAATKASDKSKRTIPLDSIVNSVTPEDLNSDGDRNNIAPLNVIEHILSSIFNTQKTTDH